MGPTSGRAASAAYTSCTTSSTSCLCAPRRISQSRRSGSCGSTCRASQMARSAETALLIACASCRAVRNEGARSSYDGGGSKTLVQCHVEVARIRLVDERVVAEQVRRNRRPPIAQVVDAELHRRAREEVAALVAEVVAREHVRVERRVDFPVVPGAVDQAGVVERVDVAQVHAGSDRTARPAQISGPFDLRLAALADQV